VRALLAASNDFEFRDTETGIEVAYLRCDPPVVTRIAEDAGGRFAPNQIVEMCKAGRDVTQVTRVTGYFSKVGSWNPGKRIELKDRHRVMVDESRSTSKSSETR
jgi:hypothetical protein